MANYTGTFLVPHVIFLELAHCGTILFKYSDFFIERCVAKGVHRRVMLAQVKVLNGAGVRP